MDIISYTERVIKILQEFESPILNKISSNQIPNIEEYRYQVGYLHGLILAQDEIKKYLKQLLSSEQHAEEKNAIY